MLMDPQGKDNIDRIADLISASIAEPIAVGNPQFVVNASIGIATDPVDGANGDDLIKRAHTAMCRAFKRWNVTVACGGSSS